MIRALMVAVGGWGGRGVVGVVLTVLLYGRLARIRGAMERIALRFRAGTLRRGGVAVADARVVHPARVTPVRVWPGGFGWLVRLVGYEAAGFGSQLRAVLIQPEMVALLRAAPQAGRVLRPLCRMLAVETALVRPPRVVVPAEVAAACDDPPVVVTALVGAPVVVAPGVVAPGFVATERAWRPGRDWGRIALPVGVVAAARRHRVRRDK